MLSYLFCFLAKSTIGDAWSIWPALSALLPSWPSRSHQQTGGLTKRFVQLVVFLLLLIWTQPASAELWPSPRLSWVEQRLVVATRSVEPARDGSNGEATLRVQVTNARYGRFELNRLVDPTYGDLDGRGTCLLPQTLLLGQQYSCSIPRLALSTGDSHESTAVVVAGIAPTCLATALGKPPEVNSKGFGVTVGKSAFPTSLPAPGGDVTFTVEVCNAFDAMTVDQVGLIDDIHGNLDGRGSCSALQTLPAGQGYFCSFTASVSGNTGDHETDTITATLVANGVPIQVSDSATVTIAGAAPTATVVKTASPASVGEPGGNVTFSVRVNNNTSSSGSLNLTALVDDIHGNLDNRGTCDVPRTIASGSSYTCRFTADVTGNAGDTEVDTITATLSGSSTTLRPTDSATVTITDVLPEAAVTKTASPTTVQEPGGNVTFSVSVRNTGNAEPLSLTELEDNIHGDLDGQGTCSTPRTLAAGSTYSCSFTKTISGNAGDDELDTITAALSDDEGNKATPADFATVTITDVFPTATLSKTASPTSVPEPGGNVTFTARIQNIGSAESLVLGSLQDDVHGDLDGQGSCSVPQTLAPGGTYQCGFTVPVDGNAGDEERDTITASLADNDNNTIEPTDSALVTITNVASSLTLSKTATPNQVEEPGGDVTFEARITNTSSVDSVTITSLVDDIHGDLNGRGTCSVPQTLAPAQIYACTFIARVNGNAGDEERDTISVSGSDDDGTPVSATDSAIVTITDAVPTAVLAKTASPTSIPEPGSDVTFTVQIDNTSSGDALDLIALVDDVHGDLDGQGSCLIPQTLASGKTYSCSFVATVSGTAGDQEVDTITATLSDDEGNTITPADSATVTVTGTDWGDAPDPRYPTLAASNGARHTIEAGFFLGSGIDSESDGQPDGAAMGDDNHGSDDEDGVVVTSAFIEGTATTVEVTASQAGMLDAWIDFDDNGSWNEAGEQIFTNEPLAAGVNTLSFAVPGATAPRVVGRFRLSRSGGLSFDGPATDGEVEDHEIVADAMAPTVTSIGSLPKTLDGELVACETTPFELERLTVRFSEPMRTGSGPQAADNPVNYRVIATGPDLAFETVGCGNVGGDDLQLTIAGIAYQASGGQASAALQLAQFLGSDHYRLLVCGAITDTAGNPLGGGDFALDFRVDVQNLLRGGHFDCDLRDWLLDPPGTGLLQHADPDADDSPDSGSAQALLDGNDTLALQQCIPATGLTNVSLGGAFRVDAQDQSQVVLVRGCELFSQPDCVGPIVGSFFASDIIEDTGMAFLDHVSTVPFQATASSARCVFSSLSDAGTIDLFMDQLFARSIDPREVFTDGFESGDTSAWSTTVP